MPQDDKPLTEAERKEVRHRLSMISPYTLPKQYEQALESCEMKGQKVPPPSAIQYLVQVYKALRKRKSRGT